MMMEEHRLGGYIARGVAMENMEKVESFFQTNGDRKIDF